LKDRDLDPEGDKRTWRGKCPSDSRLLADVIRKRAPHALLVLFETGPQSMWFKTSREVFLSN
jgi:hypothetical protein